MTKKQVEQWKATIDKQIIDVGEQFKQELLKAVVMQREEFSKIGANVAAKNPPMMPQIPNLKAP